MASDIMLKMAQGILGPVCIKSFEEGDEKIYRYAHHRGIFDLREKGSDILINGYSPASHERIISASLAGLAQCASMAKSMDPSVKSGMGKIHDHAMNLQASARDSEAALEIYKAFCANRESL